MDRGSPSRLRRVIAACTSTTAGGIVGVLLAVACAAATFTVSLQRKENLVTNYGWVWYTDRTGCKTYLGIAYIALIIRGIEMPLLFFLLVAIITAQPRLALPWLVWSPAALLSVVLTKTASLVMSLTLGISEEKPSKTNYSYIISGVLLSIVNFLAQMSCIVLVEKWRQWKSASIPAPGSSIPLERGVMPPSSPEQEQNGKFVALPMGK